MAEEKLAPWYFPFEEDDSDPQSWDDPRHRTKRPVDLEAIHQKAQQEEIQKGFQEELVRADQGNPRQYESDTAQDVYRMVRAMAGNGNVKLVKDDGYEGHPKVDLKDTIDSLGWFTFETSGLKDQKATENEARDRTGNFLTATLEGLMDLEYQSGTTAGVTQHQLQPLQRLTEALQEVL